MSADKAPPAGIKGLCCNVLLYVLSSFLGVLDSDCGRREALAHAIRKKNGLVLVRDTPDFTPIKSGAFPKKHRMKLAFLYMC